jgi:hypothetical protein
MLSPLLLLSLATAQEPPSPEVMVRKFVEAFNAHDVDAMLALASPDIAWFGVSGSTLAVEARGHEALRGGLTGYFQGLPSVRSGLMSLAVSGPFVTAVEKASWTVEGQDQSQCSVSVYELAGGLVRHVWYYAAHPCEGL